ncbi:transposase, Ptta/En/Spm, transposase, Tnp1/En/Spm-like protein [Tanacetum coccineum]|uniref:Transposase, Ptta/En/Spm, transposase, Tnp1/En/Spm-like protein n=1 Tax=Tanacetum coccineum TaxID=301880 RepID=A0ABQ5AQC4_9ASTR
MHWVVVALRVSCYDSSTTGDNWEYGKPGGVKLSVTFDALNRISGKHRALFLSFLGDMVSEHIGLHEFYPGRRGSRTRNKTMGEIMRYFDVDLTVRKLVMNRLGQLLRNFRRKLRQTYILPNQDTPSKLNEVPAKYSAILKAKDWVNFVNYTATEEYKVKSAKAKMARSKCVFPHTMGRGGYAHVKEKMKLQDEEPTRGTLWLKGRVNKDGEYQDDEIRSVGDKLKETEDKIKEGTLQVDQGTDAIHLYRGIRIRSNQSMSARVVTDRACIPDVGSNGCTTVLDAVGGFVAWPKNQVVFDQKATPPSTIQMITIKNKTAPKVPIKCKNFYVPSDAMQKEANKKRSQKALVY